MNNIFEFSLNSEEVEDIKNHIRNISNKYTSTIEMEFIHALPLLCEHLPTRLRVAVKNY